MAFIHSIRTDVPNFLYDQNEFFEKVAPFTNKRLHNIFEKILIGSQIKKRHFSFILDDMIKTTNEKRVGDKFRLWKNTSLEFFKQQIEKILNSYSINPMLIDGICTVTSSGIVTPNLDVFLQDHFNFKRDLMRMPLLGYGCSGGMAAINRINEYLTAYPKKAILVCVGETLSTQYEPNISIANLVSNSIFADGYGTMLMVGNENALYEDAIVEIEETGSFLFPNSNFAIGQWMTDEGLHTHVDAKLPKLLNESLLLPLKKLIDNGKLKPSTLDYWILHQGGPKIMEAFSKTMGIDAQAVEPSLESYRQFGNQSSTSVLTALERTVVANEKVGSGFMMGIGPGVHFEYCTCKVMPNMDIAESNVCDDLWVNSSSKEMLI